MEKNLLWLMLMSESKMHTVKSQRHQTEIQIQKEQVLRQRLKGRQQYLYTKSNQGIEG